MTVFLQGIESMKKFISEFQISIDAMRTQIEKVNMQIDRLAEVSLGRSCEKLVAVIQKNTMQLAHDNDWKERLRCYIPEKCIIVEANNRVEAENEVDVDEYIFGVIKSNAKRKQNGKSDCERKEPEKDEVSEPQLQSLPVEHG